MLTRLAAALLVARVMLDAAAPGAIPPSCSLVAGWTQHGAARSYTPDNLFEYMDGNAEGYLLYGFQSMHGVTCEKQGISLLIDVSDFGEPDSAYGMFSANRDPDRPTAKIGTEGQIVPRRAVFVKGGFYVEIAANPEGDHTEALGAWSAALAETLPGTTTLPAALTWFPTAGRQSLRLVPESVLGLSLLPRGYVAQYEFGKAFVVAADSPSAATALMEKLRARFAGSTPAHAAEDAFQVTDQYLGRMCLVRKGRYVAGYANVSEPRDPVALAQVLASALP